jgi:phage/plasmid primase-like uncharacterized protein
MAQNKTLQASSITPEAALSAQVKKVRATAKGQWWKVFEALADELSPAMANAPFHVACPVHGGTDGFRLFPDYIDSGGGVCNSCGAFPNGLRLLSWLKDWSDEETLAKVSEVLSVPRAPTAAKPPSPPPMPSKDPVKARHAAALVWKGTRPIEVGSPAQKYLLKRGIWKENVSEALRFHPSLGYFDSKSKKFIGYFPAIIAPIRNLEGDIVSLHRIYLTEEGDKAPVPEVKKLMSSWGPLPGAAVRLYQHSSTLSVAEGIETALAVRAITRSPVWSCVNATLMERLELPKDVSHLVIWADKDPSNRGFEAATILADRAEKQGIVTNIFLPNTEKTSMDWLDVLNEQGILGFPAAWRKWRPASTA